jgi:hypothetical protein
MKNELIPVRLSHLLGQSGVGAIVRGAKGLVVVQDTRQWTDRQGFPGGEIIRYVDRVRAALDIKEQLREPPIAKELEHGQVDGVYVPATRFPSWTRCPSCGALEPWPWKNNPSDQIPNCTRHDCKRHPRLEQVSWVLVHPDGYLSDVPWHNLTHKSARNPTQKNCAIRDQLRLIERGYDQREIRCDACRVSTSFRGDEWMNFGQERMQPWTADDFVPKTENTDKNLAQVLVLNDTRVYSPKSETVLVIPPESRVRKGTVVDLLYRNSKDRRRIDSARTPLAKKGIIRTLATEYRCEPDDIKTAWADIAGGYPLYGEKFTPRQLKESEFKAFLEVLPDQREDEDLVTRNKSEDWDQLGKNEDLNSDVKNIIQGVRHLVRVDRLKAVRVFRGFARLDWEIESSVGTEKNSSKEPVPPDIIGKSDWLPAIELYGEGIFFALDEDRLRKWEETPAVVSRLEQLQPRFNQSGRNDPNPLTTRFMLLHTLSHLLMRQIEFEGGYPAASLIERIYCSTTPEPMAGILIHVAVPDIAGSLGGLADLAEPKRFLGILTRALEHSHWCSLDPVCSEHEGQGPGLLNRAACHACALVPEPACEYGNTLLDRVFVKGDADIGLPSFFEIA